MSYQDEKSPPTATPAAFESAAGQSPAQHPTTESGAPAAESAATEPDALQQLREQVSQLELEKSDLRNALIRLQADFENFRKRISRERQEDGQRHTAAAVEALLPILDAFERAFANSGGGSPTAVLRGFELVHRQLSDALSRMGLERVEARGRHFDPLLHQAVEREETAQVEEGTVVEELRAGYRFRQRVLRPALVRVAVAPPAAREKAETSPSAEDAR